MAGRGEIRGDIVPQMKCLPRRLSPRAHTDKESGRLARTRRASRSARFIGDRARRPITAAGTAALRDPRTMNDVCSSFRVHRSSFDLSWCVAWTSIERLASIKESDAVWRASLRWGDRVTVVTLNSVYTLIAIDHDSFIVSGGWFDRTSASPARVKVAGCTWGGTAINRKVIAAPGLHLELGNRVVTTQIQQVIFEPFDSSAEPKDLERATGLEPATLSLGSSDSTN